MISAFPFYTAQSMIFPISQVIFSKCQLPSTKQDVNIASFLLVIQSFLMGCEISADASDATNKFPNKQLEKAELSPSKSTKDLRGNEKVAQPENPLRRAEELERQEKHADALIIYQRLFQGETESKELALAMLRCSKKVGSDEDILKRLLTYHHLDQQEQSVCQEIAERYQKGNDYENAAIFYQKLVKHFPKEDKYVLHLASIHQKNHKYGQALACYKRLAKANPQNLDILKAMNHIHKTTSQHEPQLKCLLTMIKLDPKNKEFLYQCGLIHLQKLHQSQQAKPYFQQLTEIDPESSNYHRYLAECHLKTNLLTEAESEFLKAISLKEDSYDAYLGLANSQYLLAKYHEANESFLKAMEYNSEQEHSYLGLGKSYMMLGEFQQSIECLQKAIEKNPKNAETFLNLAKTYKAQQKNVWCRKWLQKCLDINEIHEEANLMLGNLKMEEKKFQEALPFYNKIIEVNTKNLEAFVHIGEIYQEKESFGFAEKWFRKAIDVDSKSELPHIKLGLQYLSLEKYPQAVQSFKEACTRCIEGSQQLLQSHEGLILGYFMNNQYQNSIDQFIKSNENYRSNIHILLSVSFSQINLKKYEESYEMLMGLKQIEKKSEVDFIGSKFRKNFQRKIQQEAKKLIQALTANESEENVLPVTQNLKEELQFYTIEENISFL